MLPQVQSAIHLIAEATQQAEMVCFMSYIVTITPKYENKNDIVIKVKSFYDQENLDPEEVYAASNGPAGYVEGT